MDVVATQLAELQARYPDAHTEQTSDGQRVAVVPDVPVSDGWSLPTVTLRVLVPDGYPHVHLDCFYTETDLRLASGAEPANSSIQDIFGGQYRWFSWHAAAENAGNGSLDKYVRFCERRLKE